MNSLQKLLLIFPLFICANSFSKEIIIKDLGDSGPGTFRDAFDMGLVVDGDSVIIDVKGEMELQTPIQIIGLNNVTIIGPYAEHLRIKPQSGGFVGESMMEITGCSNIQLQFLSFNGNGEVVRALQIENNPGQVKIVRTLFENLTMPGFDGGAIYSDNTNTEVLSCSFIANNADGGGAIYFGTVDSKVENCTFHGNIATVNDGGAIFVGADPRIDLVHNTFFENDASGTGEVLFASDGGAYIYLNNCAGAGNGGGNEFDGPAFFDSGGGNVFKTNIGETIPPGPLGGASGDNFSNGVTPGLRPNILKDGYGLKYFTITESGSDFIDAGNIGGTAPPMDCRMAPRSLDGDGDWNPMPDAGACEYTRLRVLNNSGNQFVTYSLPWALDPSNTTDFISFVEFDIPGFSVSIINPDMQMIVMSNPYLIDGFSQDSSAIPGPALQGNSGVTPGNYKIHLRDNNGIMSGLQYQAGVNGSLVKGLRITEFDFAGIEIMSNDVKVYGCEIGIDELNNSLENRGAGIIVQTGTDQQIGGKEHWQRNVVSGNGLSDWPSSNVYVASGVTSVQIYGNIVGAANDGTTTINSAMISPYGVFFSVGASVVIGEVGFGKRNTISGNNIGVYSDGGSFSYIYNNHIGTDYDGYATVSNTQYGIFFNSSSNVIDVGKAETGGGNLISGNTASNIDIASASDIYIQNNIIGLNKNATAPLGSTNYGVYMNATSATNIYIGGWSFDEKNIISGGNNVAIRITNAGFSCFVQYNWIGLYGDGLSGPGNAQDGIILDNTLSSPFTIRNNVISGHQSGSGRAIYMNATNGHTVTGNIIGLDKDGANIVSNNIGIQLFSCGSIEIGGDHLAGDGNIISGNNGNGIEILNNGIDIKIEGNFIGTDITGMIDFGNGDNGIRLEGASGTIIGGTSGGAVLPQDKSNLISGNTNNGILLTGSGTFTTIFSNFIGLDYNGTAAIANTTGIRIQNTHEVNIGGISGEENIISGNTANGIHVESPNVVIDGNIIGLGNGGVTAGVGNGQNGVLIEAPTIFVGGLNLNVLANNGNHGVFLNGDNADSCEINNCYIGNDGSGALGMGNGGDGIAIFDGDVNKIGSVDGNEIIGNTGDGIHIYGSATQNYVVKNTILDAFGTGLTNNNGIQLSAGASYNTIGGVLGTEGNFIGSSLLDGILLQNGAHHNVIYGNGIGNDAGMTVYANGLNGIRIEDSDSNRVGDENFGGNSLLNIVSGNNIDATAAGIVIEGTSNGNEIFGNYIGVAVDGITALPNGNSSSGMGIFTSSTSSNTKIGDPTNQNRRNTISGNSFAGIYNYGNNTHIEYNTIGLGADGISIVGVQIHGILDYEQVANDTYIFRNIIAGNDQDGIRSRSTSAQILGNYIGYDINMSPVGTQQFGVVLETSASTGTYVGSDPANQYGNIIGNQNQAGIRILDNATFNNIYANYIGVDSSGAINSGAQPIGIRIEGDAGDGNSIGAAFPGSGNFISGNDVGISIDGAQLTTIYNNYIGTDLTGSTALPNSVAGIQLLNGTFNSFVGGPGANQGNTISGNGSYGIQIDGAGTDGNTIEGNYIGLDPSGTFAIGNGIGVYVSNDAESNEIGDAWPGAGNYISGNGIGVQIDNADNNAVQNNLIGQTSGNVHGIIVSGGATGNTIGGHWTTRNIIANNDSIGVALVNATGNFVTGNFIGTSANGNSPNANLIGVFLENATLNQIGDAGQFEFNLVSSNTLAGIVLENGADNNFVQNNYVGLDSTGNNIFAASGNGVGIAVINGVSNTIGGNFVANEGNIICNNTDQGILLDGASGTHIEGNDIGINYDEDTYYGNGAEGILLYNSDNNFIGASSVNHENAVAANSDGIVLRYSDGNLIQNNFIGNDASGGLDGILAGSNLQDIGIHIDSASTNNTINELNIISGNQDYGIEISGVGTEYNTVANNYIGVDLNGTTTYPNGNGGIILTDSTMHNTIGGSSSSDRNVISGNGGAPNGIQLFLSGSGVDSNLVMGNYIGLNYDGTTDISSLVGIKIQGGGKWNHIGNPGADERNYIVNQSGNAIWIQSSNQNRIFNNSLGVKPDSSPGPNGGSGVHLSNANSTYIGGLNVGTDSANVIANNYRGVVVASYFISPSQYNPIIGNEIYDNTSLGIDIKGDDLVEPLDSVQNLGNNYEIDYPILFTAFSCGGTGNTRVGIESHVVLTGTYRIDFYSNDNPDATNGEGQTHLLGTWWTPDSNPDTVDFDLGVLLTTGTSITATITGTLLNTSEFAANILVQGPPSAPVVTPTNETCLGAGDGQIDVNSPEGYYFSTDAFATVNDFGNQTMNFDSLSSGNYIITTRYLNGCTYDSPVTLNPGLALTFNQTIVGDTCGNNTGFIEIHTEGGSPGPWQYSFDDGLTFGPDSIGSGLATGNFDLVIYDPVLGCYSDTINIVVPNVDNIVDEGFVFPDFCQNASAIPSSIVTSGGIFSWEGTGPTDGAVINAATGEITNAVAGNSYNVVYTVGQCAESDTAVVTALLTDDAGFTIPDFCIGTMQVTTTNLPGGTFSFNPDPGNGAAIDPGTGAINGMPGTYNVQYVTNGSCPDSSTIAVVLYGQPLPPIIIATDSVFCFGDLVTPLSVAGTSGVVDWYEGSPLSASLSQATSFTPAVLNPGSTWFFLTETDAQGCKSLPDSIQYIQADTAGIYAIDDLEVCIASTFSLDAFGGISYSWDPHVGLSDADIPNPTATVLSSDYFVVHITDIYGCVVSDTVFVSLLPNSECDVEVYNAFSPNNDGTNDSWEIDGIEGYLENTVTVFNRWGDVIIEIENYNNTTVFWDGSNKGGDPVAAGTYYYVIEVNGEQSQAGWVQVVK